MKEVLLTNRNARNITFKGEINTNPSETLPDQAITPQELLRRYATGQNLGFKPVSAIFDEDGEEIPELYKMSKMDKLHAMQENHFDLQEKKNAFIQMQNKIKEQKAAQKAAQQQSDKEQTQLNQDDATKRSDVQED